MNNFKIYGVTTWLTTNILRSKDIQAMKFGQLIEYKMINVFLEKLCTKYGGETIPDHFLKFQN